MLIIVQLPPFSSSVDNPPANSHAVQLLGVVVVSRLFPPPPSCVIISVALPPADKLENVKPVMSAPISILRTVPLAILSATTPDTVPESTIVSWYFFRVISSRLCSSPITPVLTLYVIGDAFDIAGLTLAGVVKIVLLISAALVPENVNTPFASAYVKLPKPPVSVTLIAALTSALLTMVALPTVTLVVVCATVTLTLSELTVTLGSFTVTTTFASAIYSLLKMLLIQTLYLRVYFLLLYRPVYIFRLRPIYVTGL